MENSLNTRMDQIESKLDDILKVMHKIDLSIFGDPSINFLGVLKTQLLLQNQIDELGKKIELIEKVNTLQDNALKTKQVMTDDVEKWLKRGFWIVLLVGAVFLLVTGKIGIADLLNLK